jgi:hydroxyacylglutathione hydrolase
MHLIPIPAFADNYIWLIHNGQDALVVDPGDAQPVLDTLQSLGLQLRNILVTHHHADHVGGVDLLRDRTQAVVTGPAGEDIPQPATGVGAGDRVQALGLNFSVMDVPGHTAGHIAFFCDAFEGAPLLFCGDTLFSGGCGRLFEGTPAQMLHSLDQFAALPGHTRVCCTHEYTLSNLRFARAVEPNNVALAHYQSQCEALRAQNQPTLPSLISTELAINPFLRSRQAEVVQAMQARDASAQDEVAVFAALRAWKNNF